MSGPPSSSRSSHETESGIFLIVMMFALASAVMLTVGVGLTCIRLHLSLWFIRCTLTQGSTTPGNTRQCGRMNESINGVALGFEPVNKTPDTHWWADLPVHLNRNDLNPRSDPLSWSFAFQNPRLQQLHVLWLQQDQNLHWQDCLHGLCVLSLQCTLVATDPQDCAMSQWNTAWELNVWFPSCVLDLILCLCPCDTQQFRVQNSGHDSDAWTRLWCVDWITNEIAPSTEFLSAHGEETVDTQTWVPVKGCCQFIGPKWAPVVEGMT